MSMESLESQFIARIREAVCQCYSLGYRPMRFEQMVAERGAKAVAKCLVKSADLHYGLSRLQKLGRLDLAVESIMLEAKFGPLFNAAEREAAKWRLEQIKNKAGRVIATRAAAPQCDAASEAGT